RVQDVKEDLLNPEQRPHGAQVVEEENLHVLDGIQDLLGGRGRLAIPRRLDVPQEVAVIVEQAARPLLLHEVSEDGNGEMRLPSAGAPEEQDPLSRFEGIAFDELLGLPLREEKARFESVEVGEAALGIACRNLRGGDATRARALEAADA